MTKRVLIIGVSSALGGEVARQQRADDCLVHGTFTGRRALDSWLIPQLAGMHQFDVTSDDDLVMLSAPDRFSGKKFDEIYYMVGVASAGLEALTDADRRRVMHINYTRAYQVLLRLCDHHLAPDGVLVVASSAAAWWGLEYAPGYCVSKACLNSTLENMVGRGHTVVIWTPGAIDTQLWNQEGIPEEVQTAVRLFAPSALTAVRWLLKEVNRRTTTQEHSSVPVLTTPDAWLTYHVPITALFVNLVLSGLVELDAARRGQLPWKWRAIAMAPVAYLLRLLGRLVPA